MEKTLIDFYSGNGVNVEGRTIEEILSWSDAAIEHSHTTIQWLFPLKTESNFNPDAPLLTDEDIKIWQVDPVLQENLRRAYHRWLEFTGMRETDGSIEFLIVPKRFVEVYGYPNHNWLRITRVLLSLRTLGLGVECDRYWDALTKIHAEGMISENSFGYWRDAVQGIDRKRNQI